MHIAVIGDLGGHHGELRAELTRLGAGPDGVLPDDLVVVQVGDLVHRGPDSDGVVELVDFYLHAQPRQWIQLMGNHETIYFHPPPFHWRNKISGKSSRTLRRWWRDGNAVIAATVRTAEESFLVTHAGVTAEFWSDVLGGPLTVDEAARRINELARDGSPKIYRGGLFPHGTVASCAGPLWADTATELVPGWCDRRLPFSQIHGHSTIFDWQQRSGIAAVGINSVVTVDVDAKHETVHLHGGRLIGIDPGHRRIARAPWRALELTGHAEVPA